MATLWLLQPSLFEPRMPMDWKGATSRDLSELYSFFFFVECFMFLFQSPTSIVCPFVDVSVSYLTASFLRNRSLSIANYEKEKTYSVTNFR